MISGTLSYKTSTGIIQSYKLTKEMSSPRNMDRKNVEWGSSLNYAQLLKYNLQMSLLRFYKFLLLFWHTRSKMNFVAPIINNLLSLKKLPRSVNVHKQTQNDDQYIIGKLEEIDVSACITFESNIWSTGLVSFYALYRALNHIEM